MLGRVTSPWLALGSLVLGSVFAGRAAAQQSPLVANDLVPKQTPGRNSEGTAPTTPLKEKPESWRPQASPDAFTRGNQRTDGVADLLVVARHLPKTNRNYPIAQ